MANELHTLSIAGVNYPIQPLSFSATSNTITTTANDTTANWGGLGCTVHFYTTAGQLVGQPHQYGLLVNYNYGSEVHQLWMTQASGSMHHRGGNSNGWSGGWRCLVDDHNYSTWFYNKTDTDNRINTAIANLVNSAPDTLNTLKELSDALGADPNFATTITNHLANKANKDGSNATGTWPISITGHAGSAGAVAWGNITGKPTLSTIVNKLHSVSSNGTYYYKLGTLPASVNYTGDSFVIRGSIGSYGSAGKSHIDVSVSRRDGITFKGFIHDMRSSIWNLGVNNAGEVILVITAQYAAWSLELHTLQGTIDYTEDPYTPADTNITYITNSANVVKFTNAGRAVMADGLGGYSCELAANDTTNTWVPVFVGGAIRHREIPAAYNNAPSTLSVNYANSAGSATNADTVDNLHASDLIEYGTSVSPYNANSTGWYKFLTLVAGSNDGTVDFIISSGETNNLGVADYYHFETRPSNSIRQFVYTHLGKGTNYIRNNVYAYTSDNKTYTFYIKYPNIGNWECFCKIRHISSRGATLTYDNTWQTATPSGTAYAAEFAGYVKDSMYTANIGDSTSSYTKASLDTALGDKYSYSTARTKNTVLAAPNGNNGSATFRALVAADLPSHGIHVPGIKSARAVTTLNWDTDNTHVPDLSLLAYWNGAYTDTSSNLTYAKGGTIITSGSIGSQSVAYATTAGSAVDQTARDSAASKFPSTGGLMSGDNRYIGSTMAGGTDSWMIGGYGSNDNGECRITIKDNSNDKFAVQIEDYSGTTYRPLVVDSTGVAVTGSLSVGGTSVSLNGHTHSWGNVSGKPSFATVATSGSYNDLSNVPIKHYEIDLAGKSTSNFYPCYFDASDLETDCEIHSPNVGDDNAYNQNRIHFLLTSQGWSDAGSTFVVLSHSVYSTTEITIGAIARGNQGGAQCVWLRGGLKYRIKCNKKPNCPGTDVTNGKEKFTVGTNYDGGTNAQITVLWKYGDTTQTSTHIANRGNIGNGTVTIKQNGTSKGTFTMNQSGNTTIELTDTNTDNNTTYSFSGGTNCFYVTPSGGSKQTVNVTPSVDKTSALNVPRVAKSCNSIPGINKCVVEEYTSGANYDLPSNSWYHIYTSEGTDSNYATQLALGMTTNAAYYRNYNNKTWSSWYSIINTDTNTWRPVTDSVATTSSSTCASATAVKKAYDLAASKGSGTVTSVTPGVGLKLNGKSNGDSTAITSSGTIDLQVASSSEIGGIKIGYSASGKNYPVQLDSNNKAYVNVPWTDNNTDTSTNYDGHYTPSGSTKTGTASGSTLSFGGAVVTGLTYDGKGHVTGFSTSKLPSNPNTDTKVKSTATKSAYYLCGSSASATATGELGKRSDVYVNASGQLLSAKGFFESSDERLKNFGESLDVDLDKIKNLPKKYFTWKNDKDNKLNIGTSAQELQKLYPEIVSEGVDGYLSVNYEKLSIIALAAIDKLADKQKELEERLAKIEAALNL